MNNQSNKRNEDKAIKTSCVASMVLGVGLAVMGSTTRENAYKESFQEAVKRNEIDYHVAAIQRDEEEVKKLERKTQILDEGITQLKKRIFLDLKGFRVSGWKNLKGSWQGNIHELRERMAWHTKEVARLADPIKDSDRVKNDNHQNS